MSCYTLYSEAYLGTTRQPQCDKPVLQSRGHEVVPCAGPVEFVWLHSGHADGEATVCGAHISRIRELGQAVSPRLGYEHALYRDQERVWRLRGDAKPSPWPEDAELRERFAAQR